MDVYWIQDHEKRGPLPEVEVISMLEAGLIPETVRAWHAGCGDWVQIRELPVLKEMFARKDEEERRSLQENAPAENSDSAGAEECGDEEAAPEERCPGEKKNIVLVVPYPYVRFLGRMADVMMHLTLYLAVLRLFGIGFHPGLLPGSYEALLYICLPMTLIEAVFLSTLGTTPGKSMLSVTVRDYLGNRLPFSTAFRRSLFVMVLGLGCFAPTLSVLALFFSWWWVRRFGFTPWDRRLGTTDVLNEPISYRKMAMALVLIILCLQIMYFLVLPWLPDMEAYVQMASQM